MKAIQIDVALKNSVLRTFMVKMVQVEPWENICVVAIVRPTYWGVTNTCMGHGRYSSILSDGLKMSAMDLCSTRAK